MSKYDFHLPSNGEITLGGLLTLRQEAELLNELGLSDNPIRIVFQRKNKNRFIPTLWKKIFHSSELDFIFIENDSNEIENSKWPKIENESDFSYHSFFRIEQLYKECNIKPRLKWAYHLIKAIRKKNICNFDNVISLHLRNISPFSLEESNIEENIWYEFLRKIEVEYPFLKFALIGDDQIPSNISDLENVFVAKRFFTLEEQLAFVTISRGFLGMASGICTAANFSDVPYLVIKSPEHHKAEMEKELGQRNRFNFSNTNQQLWRVEQSGKVLEAGLNLILDKTENGA